MKVYEWQETEHHYIAVIRPKELFDVATLEKPTQGEPEARLRAHHRLTNQMEGYAIAYSKGGHALESLKLQLEKSPDIYAARDDKDQEKLKSEPHQKSSVKRLQI
ncbi:MAG: hypothetical protein RDV48_05275 [Candidatus Eremiobacteraeota bacterium]|nr:hypothetical protein [Candidatus Eremiobacteraeota bacterium]